MYSDNKRLVLNTMVDNENDLYFKCLSNSYSHGRVDICNCNVYVMTV